MFGTLADKSITALVDSGSKKSFLGYSFPSKSNPVSDAICSGLIWSLQGQEFTNDLRLLAGR